MFAKFKEYSFLFSELVKRDFKKKYKGTYLGMLWSVMSPLLTLLIMSLVFGNFFQNQSVDNFIIYLFCGNIVFSYFTDATNGGMSSLVANAHIFAKINVPKYLFLLSRNVSAFINFSLTFGVFLIFCIIFQIPFSFYFLAIIIPIFFLVIFNIGMGLILSAMNVFFRDIAYLWSVFTMLIMYVSAIFYNPYTLAPGLERIFMLNPIYTFIKYFRCVTIGINGNPPAMPSLLHHAAMIGYSLLALGIGALIYKKKNHQFLYYI